MPPPAQRQALHRISASDGGGGAQGEPAGRLPGAPSPASPAKQLAPCARQLPTSFAQLAVEVGEATAVEGTLNLMLDQHFVVGG